MYMYTNIGTPIHSVLQTHVQQSLISPLEVMYSLSIPQTASKLQQHEAYFY